MSNIDLNASEERVNVNHRRLGTSAGRGRVRVLAAGLVLLAAGAMVLGWGSRSRQLAAPSADSSSFQSLAASPLAMAATSADAKPAVQARALSVFAALPLMFEPNQGQANLDPADPRAKFVARGSGYGLFLGPEGATLSLRSRNSKRDSSKYDARVETLQMKLAGANANASLAGANPLPGKSNYLLGNDPKKWQRNIPQFARVRYENIYPGINLVFYGNQGHLEYDFQVAPGADPSQADLQFDGAKQLELKDGALVITGENGSMRLEAPHVYQQIAGHQETVQGSFVLRAANHAGFTIGPYDHTRELVIDPALNFSTYFGGTGDERATSVAVDGGGNIYLAGSTTSASLATAGVLQTALNGAQNVYVAKITPPLGSNPAVLDYVTYLGGDGTDSPVGVGVDAAGDAFVAGTTSSTNFPTSTSGYQTVPETGSLGTQHVFVTELNNIATLPLVYSSYLSGNGDDIATGMTIDSKGYIYVTGTTRSSDVASTTVQFPASTLPQALPYQSAPRAPIQFFVTKVNTRAPKTGSIAYSTYFGGGNFNTTDPIATGGGIAVDTNGNMYFTGTTNFIYTGCQGCQTTDFPILNAYQPCLDQPTASNANPQACLNTDTTSNSDGFVAKLNPNAAQGQQLLWSTYLGGTQTDTATGVAIDSGAANVYLTGTTNSPDVTAVTTFAAFQPCLDAPTGVAGACPNTLTTNDAYVARLSNPALSTTATNMSLTYFSYLGGSADEAGLAVTVDAASGALVTGWTTSADFPIAANNIQGIYGGNQDAFLARINTAAVTGQETVGSWTTFYGGSDIDEGTSVALDVNQNLYFAGDTKSTSATLQMKAPLGIQASGLTGVNNNGGYDAFVAQVSPAASLSITGILSLGTNQTYVNAGWPATFTYTLTNNGPDPAYGIVVSDNISTSVTQVPVSFVSAATTSGPCSGGSTTTNISCSISALNAGSTATIIIELTPTASTSGNAQAFNGGAVQATGQNNITPANTIVSAQMSDYSIGVSPSSFTVAAAGDKATYTVQLTPHPVYANIISLTVSGLPTGAVQTFTPSSVTLAGTSPGTSTLTISTTARPITTPVASLVARHFYAIWLSVPGLAIVGIGVGGSRRRRRLAGVLLLAFVSMLLLLQPACSHSTTQPPVSGTPAGTYPLTVTATAGTDTKSFPITLTVP